MLYANVKVLSDYLPFIDNFFIYIAIRSFNKFKFWGRYFDI